MKDKVINDDEIYDTLVCLNSLNENLSEGDDLKITAFIIKGLKIAEEIVWKYKDKKAKK